MSQPWQGMTVLIAGGAGFVGSAVARRLLELGANVRVIDLMLTEAGANLYNFADIQGRVDFCHGDVRNPRLLDPLLQKVDVVFSLVGLSGHRQSFIEPFADLEANVAAPLAVLDGCRRCAPNAIVVYSSSRQVYGRPQQLPIPEQHPIVPLDINAVHTAAAEHYHRVFAEIVGIDTRVLRLTHIVGPGMRVRDARQSFLGLWIRNLVQAQPFEVWGGQQRRDFSDIDDVVHALLALARSKLDRRRVFNLSGQVLSLRALADRLIEINGGGRYDVLPLPEAQASIDLGDSFSDASRLAVYADLPPAQPLDLTLEKTLNYYRAHLAEYL